MKNGRRTTTESYGRELLVRRVAAMFEAVVECSKSRKKARDR